MSDILQDTDTSSQPSFTFRNRMMRWLWNIVYVLCFRYSPKPFHFWRRLILSIFGARIARDCHVYPKAKIWAPWNLIMDEKSCLADEVNCYSMAEIKIGRKAVVSQGAHLCAGTHDYENPRFPLQAFPISIGAKAWICTESFVGPGVTIGEGAILAARAVAMKDIPEWKVYAGNPCQLIKERKKNSP